MLLKLGSGLLDEWGLHPSGRVSQRSLQSSRLGLDLFQPADCLALLVLGSLPFLTGVVEVSVRSGLGDPLKITGYPLLSSHMAYVVF